jgi:hypothetical protein
MATRFTHKTTVDNNERVPTTVRRGATPKETALHHRGDHGDDGDAFVPDVARTHGRLVDDEAEAFAEEFIAGATSGESVGEDARDEWIADEVGGPFLLVNVTRHDLERMAADTDEKEEEEDLPGD